MSTRRSSARVHTDGSVIVRLASWARLLGMALSVRFHPGTSEPRDVAAADVGRLLRWKIGGTGISRQRAMGWFTFRDPSTGNAGRAWVWLTPGRTVRVFEIPPSGGRSARLYAIPVDWFV